jgi:hypothetical protein
MCLFNDVAIAVADLRRRRRWRVAVLDTDAHHADGSLDVLGPDIDTLYGCVCIEGFAPPYPETFDVRVGAGLESEAYLETALGAFAPRVRRFRPELIVWYFGFDLLDGEYASLGFHSDLLWHLAAGLVSLADEVARGRLLAVLGGGKEPGQAQEALAAVISGLASSGSLPDLPGVERTEAPARAPSREWVEMTFGPLGAGKQEVTVGAASVTPRRALEQLGLSYEDIDAIDLIPVEEGERWALRYFDPEDRRVVVMEFGPDFSIVSETRVHVKEWMGDDYYGFNWPAGCPWSLG